MLQESNSINYFSKENVKSSSAPKRIAKIQFGTLLTEEIQKVSELQVSCRDVYKMNPNKVPATYVSIIYCI